jgi:hypothetical protein
MHSLKPLDETVWRAWLEKNRVEEAQRAIARIQVVKWTCIGVLIASGVVSSYISSPYDSAYQAVVSFAIALGAIVLIIESLRARQYSFTILFAAIVLLFNPILPTFALAGSGLFLFASVLPFVASLIWMKERSRRAKVPTSALG